VLYDLLALVVLERAIPAEDASGRALLAAWSEDEPRHLNVSPSHIEADLTGYLNILEFLNEHGIPSPPALIARLALPLIANSFMMSFIEIAEALQNEDAEELSRTIERAEGRGLLVHAARLRIVLAQRTGELAELERARPVLERLGDRRFLRRLEEVAAALDGKGKLL
jgi:hypothetical protein